METTSIKSLAIKVLQRNSEGNQPETLSFPDRKLDPLQFPCKETGNPPSCFDPEGLLAEAISEAIAQGWSNDRLLECVEELREAGALKVPWGLKVRNSPIGDYWILSDSMARECIPAGALSFTLEELMPIVAVSRTFPGAKVVRFNKTKSVEAKPNKKGSRSI